MRLGVSVPHYRPFGRRDTVLAVIDAAEELGFDSVWTTDHIVVPRSMPDPYGEMLESLTVLGVAAGRTSRLLLGTSVIVLPQREPLLLAKQVATLHHLSAGRVMLGVGVGWLEREFEALGAPFKRRGVATTEAIALLRTIWEGGPEDAADPLADLVFSPTNDGLPRIPVFVGGNSDLALARAAQSGDGWHAVNRTVDEVASGVAAMRSHGVHTPVVQLRLPIIPGDPAPDASSDRALTGTAREMIFRIKDYERAGVSHVTVDPTPGDRDAFLRDLRWIADEVLPFVQDRDPT